MDPKKNRGRPPTRPVKKPNLQVIVLACGGISKLAKDLNISPPRIANWLYSDTMVPQAYCKKMSELVNGLITVKEINNAS